MNGFISCHIICCNKQVTNLIHLLFLVKYKHLMLFNHCPKDTVTQLTKSKNNIQPPLARVIYKGKYINLQTSFQEIIMGKIQNIRRLTTNLVSHHFIKKKNLVSHHQGRHFYCLPTLLWTIFIFWARRLTSASRITNFIPCQISTLFNL